MATITLEYDARNSNLKKVLDLFVSLGAKVLTRPEEKKLTAIDISLQEAKKGKIVKCDSVDDMFKKLEMACK